MSHFHSLMTLLGSFAVAGAVWHAAPLLGAELPGEAGEPTADEVCPHGKKPRHAELSFASGRVRKFGEWANTCARDKSGALMMQVEGRNGDYAMCCVDLQRPLDLKQYSTAKADVVVGSAESAIEVKLEDGPAQIRILDAAVQSDTSKSDAWEFRFEERALRPRRICLAATGVGETPNRIQLRSISFRGCE